MRAAGITTGIAEFLSQKGNESPTTRGREAVSGGVEFDVVVGTGRPELVAVVALGCVVGEAQVDIGLLGVGIAGVGVLGVAGEFGGVACRKFPEFALTVACGRTLLLRPAIAHSAVLRARHTVEILDGMSRFMRYGHL
jgi:hypothetical protein